jgi:inorganic pyrophosphatase
MEIITAIIETPKGSTEKYNYDEKSGFFKLKKILPAGMMFPYDFGFIPDTKGEDGDPLDIIIISEFHSFPGCMMECRLIGALKAIQTEKKKKLRNDRFIAIPVQSTTFKKIETVNDLSHNMIEELEEFFINYNKAEGKLFKPLEMLSVKQAIKLMKKQ